MTEVAAASQPVAIRCGRLLDVETGTVTSDRVLHVGPDGRISAIGSTGDGLPDDAETIDLSASPSCPG